MKRVFVLIALLFFTFPLFGQRIRTSDAGDILTVELPVLTSATSTDWFPVYNLGPTTHSLTFSYQTQPGAVTVALQCSNNFGTSSTSTIGSSTSTTGATISGSATCTHVRMNVSGLTGSIAIRGVYRGTTSSGTVSVETGDLATEVTLAAAAASLATLDNVVSGSEAQVDIVSSALPSGAATSANQTTEIGHVDGIEGLITTLNSLITTLDGVVDNILLDTADIETAAEDTTPVGVYPQATTSGGCSVSSAISSGAVLETQVKGTAGMLHSVQAYSLDATPVYLKFYNDTGANVDETDTPVLRYMIPANSTAANGAGNNIEFGPVGVEFSTAITYRVVTGFADNSTGALTADEVIVNVCYK